jgi:S-adenosylmethionine:tRNA ribosyltransferase-isomerase
VTGRLSFALPPELEAGEPPEARGLTRDGVRMLVARKATGELVHSTFALLPHFLDAGDLVVINTSGTLPAALDALTSEGVRATVHLSTQLDARRWVVEVRRDGERWGADPPRFLALGEGASVTLVEPYLGSERLFVAELDLPLPTRTWLTAHGRPIHYG